MDFFKKYNGIKANEFKHIPEISYYNHNYYIGLSKNDTIHDLLYAESDDDNYTAWFIITRGGRVSFAESFTSEGEILHVFKED
ncbi:MAG: hypothetical protein ACM3UU_02920 [Ignavibacteriales bacterium]